MRTQTYWNCETNYVLHFVRVITFLFSTLNVLRSYANKRLKLEILVLLKNWHRNEKKLVRLLEYPESLLLRKISRRISPHPLYTCTQCILNWSVSSFCLPSSPELTVRCQYISVTVKRECFIPYHNHTNLRDDFSSNIIWGNIWQSVPATFARRKCLSRSSDAIFMKLPIMTLFTASTVFRKQRQWNQESFS